MARIYTPSRGRFSGKTFSSKHRYREALARAKGFKSYYAERSAFRAVPSRKELNLLHPTAQQKRSDALQVLSIMRREGQSLGSAIQRFNRRNPQSHISGRSVRKYVGVALSKRQGRYKPKPYDRLLRVMAVPTRRGEVLLEIRDSRTAAKLSRYWNAVQNWLVTGDSAAIRQFRGVYFRSNRLQYRLITDLDELEQLADFGEFRLESIYEQVAAGGGR